MPDDFDAGLVGVAPRLNRLVLGGLPTRTPRPVAHRLRGVEFVIGSTAADNNGLSVVAVIGSEGRYHGSNPSREAAPKERCRIARPFRSARCAATIGDLLKRLGNIPPGRVRLRPFPGTATEKDVLQVLDDENRPCELVEGTLVEKPMGYEESEIAGLLITFLNNFARPRKLGIVTGADGTIRLFPGLVRIPDVAFASWDCFPDRKRPKARIPQIAPDLVVEVLSKGNTKRKSPGSWPSTSGPACGSSGWWTAESGRCECIPQSTNPS